MVGFEFDLNYFNNKKFTLNSLGDVIIKPNFHKVINGLGLSRGNSKGNLIIQFEIIFPESLTKEQKEKLKDIL